MNIDKTKIETQEILDYLKTSSKSKDFCGLMITKTNLDKVLDYIAKLEQENKKMTYLLNNEFVRIVREKMVDKLSANEMILLQKRIIDKAIEKLESIRVFGLRSGKTLLSTLINESIDILKGSDE